MSIICVYSVACDNDGCPSWTSEVGGDLGVQVARAEAKRLGWKRRRVNGKVVDLCPDCSRSAIEGQPGGEPS